MAITFHFREWKLPRYHFIGISAFDTLLAAAAAWWHYRHLCMWQVFAPHFLFSAGAFLVILAVFGVHDFARSMASRWRGSKQAYATESSSFGGKLMK
jgi:hypothetical protein